MDGIEAFFMNTLSLKQHQCGHRANEGTGNATPASAPSGLASHARYHGHAAQETNPGLISTSVASV